MLFHQRYLSGAVVSVLAFLVAASLSVRAQEEPPVNVQVDASGRAGPAVEGAGAHQNSNEFDFVPIPGVQEEFTTEEILSALKEGVPTEMYEFGPGTMVIYHTSFQGLNVTASFRPKSYATFVPRAARQTAPSLDEADLAAYYVDKTLGFNRMLPTVTRTINLEKSVAKDKRSKKVKKHFSMTEDVTQVTGVMQYFPHYAQHLDIGLILSSLLQLCSLGDVDTENYERATLPDVEAEDLRIISNMVVQDFLINDEGKLAAVMQSGLADLSEVTWKRISKGYSANALKISELFEDEDVRKLVGRFDGDQTRGECKLGDTPFEVNIMSNTGVAANSLSLWMVSLENTQIGSMNGRLHPGKNETEQS
eukprot:GFYU01024206.1.p1 GENE.GFYU01024206.1~~GFYU01024206.1.p1  ORF type:complete len:364 (-),score=81.13 GFYU01024206.1:299-1390(-)